MPASGPNSLEERRAQLIRFLEVNRPQGSLSNKVTIVFDGRSGVYGGRVEGYISVIFSSDESADDKIRRIVEQQENRKNIIVVTNDRDIQYAVRALGAKVEGVEGFLARAVKGPSEQLQARRGKPSGERPKTISKTLEAEITDEFKRIWLKPNDTGT